MHGSSGQGYADDDGKHYACNLLGGVHAIRHTRTVFVSIALVAILMPFLIADELAELRLFVGSKKLSPIAIVLSARVMSPVPLLNGMAMPFSIFSIVISFMASP